MSSVISVSQLGRGQQVLLPPARHSHGWPPRSASARWDDGHVSTPSGRAVVTSWTWSRPSSWCSRRRWWSWRRSSRWSTTGSCGRRRRGGPHLRQRLLEGGQGRRVDGAVGSTPTRSGTPSSASVSSSVQTPSTGPLQSPVERQHGLQRGGLGRDLGAGLLARPTNFLSSARPSPGRRDPSPETARRLQLLDRLDGLGAVDPVDRAGVVAGLLELRLDAAVYWVTCATASPADRR